MNARTLLDAPVPELPAVDVERAQEHYRDALGFAVNWLSPDKSIGAVTASISITTDLCTRVVPRA